MGSQPHWKAVIESSGANSHATPTSRFPRPLQESPPSRALPRSDPAFMELAKDASRKPSSISPTQRMVSSSERLSAERTRTRAGCAVCTSLTNPAPPSPIYCARGATLGAGTRRCLKGNTMMPCARMGRGHVINGWHLQMRPQSHHETRHLGMTTLISLPEHSF